MAATILFPQGCRMAAAQRAPAGCSGCSEPAVTHCPGTRPEAIDLDGHLTFDRPLPPGHAWDISQTWQMLPDDDGKWDILKPVDTSAYRDTTADGKGRIVASGEGFPKEGYANAFDDQPSKWCIKTPTVWIEYHYAGDTRHEVTAYTLTTANDAPPRDPRDWQLLGSNDGEIWTLLDERKNEPFIMRFEKRLFKVGKPGMYAAYKVNVTRNHGADTSQLSEIELLVPKE